VRGLVGLAGRQVNVAHAVTGVGGALRQAVGRGEEGSGGGVVQAERAEGPRRPVLGGASAAYEIRDRDSRKVRSAARSAAAGAAVAAVEGGDRLSAGAAVPAPDLVPAHEPDEARSRALSCLGCFGGRVGALGHPVTASGLTQWQRQNPQIGQASLLSGEAMAEALWAAW
jgi:hypothetical protein